MNSKPSFKKIGKFNYQVWIAGVLAGTVEKVIEGYWRGFYKDGTAAYAGDTRISTSWKLINS